MKLRKHYHYTTTTTTQPGAIIEAPELAQAQPSGEPERAHLFSVAAGVALPMLQALITGALFGGAAWIYASLLQTAQAWRWGAGVAAGVVVLAWLAMLGRWLDLTAPLERLTRIDLNRDGYIGRGRPDTVRVEVTSEDRRHTTVAEIPYASKLPDFARGLISGAPISERHWSGAGALFSQSEFRQVRDIFIARGWLRWSNPEAPQQGLELTPGGRAALRALANGDIPPSLP